jgi:hypothetical protein
MEKALEDFKNWLKKLAKLLKWRSVIVIENCMGQCAQMLKTNYARNILLLTGIK